MELLSLCKKDRPEKAAALALQIVRSDVVNDMDPNTREFGDLHLSLLTHHDIQQIKALSESGNSFATLTLVSIYGRDILMDEVTVGLEKFEKEPIDHHLAKQYCNKLSSNELYAKMVDKFKTIL